MPYAIRVTRQFFGPYCKKSYVEQPNSRDDGDERVEFKHRRDAQALVDTLNSVPYHTSHNESGRPEYKVVRVRNHRR